MGRYGTVLAVAAGGGAGALARWAAVTAVPDDRIALVVAGLNVVGSLLLGVLLGSRERLPEVPFHGLGAGFCGGLTTFSTYAVSVAAQLEDGRMAAATANGVGTLVGALLAAGLGYRMARTVGRPRPRPRARTRVRARGAR